MYLTSVKFPQIQALKEAFKMPYLSMGVKGIKPEKDDIKVRAPRQAYNYLVLLGNWWATALTLSFLRAKVLTIFIFSQKKRHNLSMRQRYFYDRALKQEYISKVSVEWISYWLIKSTTVL